MQAAGPLQHIAFPLRAFLFLSPASSPWLCEARGSLRLRGIVRPSTFSFPGPARKNGHYTLLVVARAFDHKTHTDQPSALRRPFVSIAQPQCAFAVAAKQCLCGLCVPSGYDAAYTSYGIQGVSAPSNQPGPRKSFLFVCDKHNNIWLSSGDGLVLGPTEAGLLTDTWKYDTGTGEWTWITGVTANYGTRNVSGTLVDFHPRQEMAYTYDSIHDRMFGGVSPAGPLVYDDMLYFEVSTAHWVWAAGSSNPATDVTAFPWRTGSTF